MSQHEIRWQNDGMIGYQCVQDRLHIHTLGGLDEGDRVVTCPSCGVRLKGSWCVTLTETDEPETTS